MRFQGKWIIKFLLKSWMSGEDGLIRIKEWVGGSIRGCGWMFRVSESRTSSSWIQKKKKKINKSMLIHVHSEISNMFLLKGKSHFSGAVSFWRNLQSQRDRNILPKKRGQTQIPTWEKKSDTEGLCPSHTISEFPLSCTDKKWINSKICNQQQKI